MQKQIGRFQLILNSAVGSTISPISSNRNADFYRFNVHKGPSPGGTPLQLAWRCFHSPELKPITRVDLAELMKVLIENGADTNWTEPCGTVVSKSGLLAWCDLSFKQLRSQSEFDHAFCRVSGDTYEYPLYATPAQVDKYTSLHRRLGFTEEILDTEDYGWSKSSLSGLQRGFRTVHTIESKRTTQYPIKSHR